MELKLDMPWEEIYAAIYRPMGRYLHAVREIDEVRLENLGGIERQKRLLVKNTERFLRGEPAVNALLWGARGTGKSSLIKALLWEYAKEGLRVVEVEKESLGIIPELTDRLRELPYYFILFCDDLSFERGDSSYKPLKSLLEGSIERLPQNIIVYATSNRRHLLPEYKSDNEGAWVGEGEIHLGDAVEEKVSLSDRFALSLGFYQGTLKGYWELVQGYLGGESYPVELEQKAINFATQKGSRSGRTAKQFYDLYRSGLIE